MSDPLVSVAIIVAAPQAGIERAVQSALAQSYRNLEILLCDGVLSQETRAITDALEPRDPRITVWREVRTAGVIETVTAARSATTGEYVLWLDGESWIGPDAVSAAVDFLDNNAAHALVCGNVIAPDANGTSGTVAPTPVAFEDGARRVEALIGNISGSAAWQGLYRRNVFADLPLHAGLGFAYGCLVSTAWRGKIGAVPEMVLHRDGSADDADPSEQCQKLGLGSFQATDPWLSVAALVFCNVAFFDNAFSTLPGVERLRLAIAAADAVSRRWKILDE
ncbi:MAG: glycosyltransferase, partial [Alphaproteobacteria bacterium]|nr:glycosyltransferase [Alphaproteobacteria bacterium]